MGSSHSASDTDGVDEKHSDSDNGCKRCCLQFKGCIMSPECGRGLQIANVVAMCGMCIRFWT